MLSTKGNPESKNLFQLLTILQDHKGIDVKVSQKEKVKRLLVLLSHFSFIISHL